MFGLQVRAAVSTICFCTERSSAEVGFIQHHDPRLEHHGAGNGDTLALTAGEFMRVAVCAWPDQAALRSKPQWPRRSRSLALSSGSCTSSPSVMICPHHHARGTTSRRDPGNTSCRALCGARASPPRPDGAHILAIQQHLTAHIIEPQTRARPKGFDLPDPGLPPRCQWSGPCFRRILTSLTARRVWDPGHQNRPSVMLKLTLTLRPLQQHRSLGRGAVALVPSGSGREQHLGYSPMAGIVQRSLS